jgi:hypothetical protein
MSMKCTDFSSFLTLLPPIEVNILQIESMYMTRNNAENSEADVHKEIRAAARDHEYAYWRNFERPCQLQRLVQGSVALTEDCYEDDEDGWNSVRHFDERRPRGMVLGDSKRL